MKVIDDKKVAYIIFGKLCICHRNVWICVGLNNNFFDFENKSEIVKMSVKKYILFNYRAKKIKTRFLFKLYTRITQIVKYQTISWKTSNQLRNVTRLTAVKSTRMTVVFWNLISNINFKTAMLLTVSDNRFCGNFLPKLPKTVCFLLRQRVCSKQVVWAVF